MKKILLISLCLSVLPLFVAAQAIDDNNERYSRKIVKIDYAGENASQYGENEEHISYKFAKIDTIIHNYCDTSIYNKARIFHEKRYSFITEEYPLNERFNKLLFDVGGFFYPASGFYSPFSTKDGLIDVCLFRQSVLFTNGEWNAPETYSYDENNQMVSLKCYKSLIGSYIINTRPGNEDNADEVLNCYPYCEWQLTWNNGNITKGVLKDGENELASFECTYYEEECNNQFSIFNTPFREITSLSHSWLLIDRGLFGNTCKNYIKEITFTGDYDKLNGDDRYPLVHGSLNYSFTYEFDEDGYVTVVHGMNYQFNEATESYYYAGPTYFEWETIDGIVDTSISEKQVTKGIFDLQGRRLNSKPAKGIYIENGKKKVSSN